VTCTRLLIVEGNDDLSLISNLMSKRVRGWSQKVPYTVNMIAAGDDQQGGKNRVTLEFVKGRLKSGWSHVAIVLDADDDYLGTKAKLEQILIEARKDWQEVKFSFWIMPSNGSPGMIEDFALSLVESSNLLAFSEKASSEAKSDHGAHFDAGIHASKAKIRTWLAWQKEPGVRMGTAAAMGLINANSPRADAFAQWFADFFELPLAEKIAN
jgi:hypothetical protein